MSRSRPLSLIISAQKRFDMDLSDTRLLGGGEGYIALTCAFNGVPYRGLLFRTDKPNPTLNVWGVSGLQVLNACEGCDETREIVIPPLPTNRPRQEPIIEHTLSDSGSCNNSPQILRDSAVAKALAGEDDSIDFDQSAESNMDVTKEDSTDEQQGSQEMADDENDESKAGLPCNSEPIQKGKTGTEHEDMFAIDPNGFQEEYDDDSGDEYSEEYCDAYTEVLDAREAAKQEALLASTSKGPSGEPSKTPVSANKGRPSQRNKPSTSQKRGSAQTPKRRTPSPSVPTQSSSVKRPRGRSRKSEHPVDPAPARQKRALNVPRAHSPAAADDVPPAKRARKSVARETPGTKDGEQFVRARSLSSFSRNTATEGSPLATAPTNTPRNRQRSRVPNETPNQKATSSIPRSRSVPKVTMAQMEEEEAIDPNLPDPPGLIKNCFVWAKSVSHPYWPARYVGMINENEVRVAWCACDTYSHVSINSVEEFISNFGKRLNGKRKESTYSKAIIDAINGCQIDLNDIEEIRKLNGPVRKHLINAGFDIPEKPEVAVKRRSSKKFY
ncbi:hypothetical protein QR680_002205 [Steinernema hermaphroditum]|uniref:PWWP domain-containing protein n=1 Tax=Steinernema hermaphroditum TaxID=289476 RepID=A0AA39LHV5_9BILA|nr:hypothetical protein QR680_002205 [Steinernema hermaphroditum]